MSGVHISWRTFISMIVRHWGWCLWSRESPDHLHTPCHGAPSVNILPICGMQSVGWGVLCGRDVLAVKVLGVVTLRWLYMEAGSLWEAEDRDYRDLRGSMLWCPLPTPFHCTPHDCSRHPALCPGGPPVTDCLNIYKCRVIFSGWVHGRDVPYTAAPLVWHL